MRILLVSLALFGATHFSFAGFLVSGRISGMKPGTKLVFNVPFDCWYESSRSVPVVPDSRGFFSVKLAIGRPQVFFFELNGRRVRLYAEPGKSVVLSAEAPDFPRSLKFSGVLASENEFRCRHGLAWTDTSGNVHPDSIRQSRMREAQYGRRMLQKGTFPRHFRQMTEADLRWLAVGDLWEQSWRADAWTAGDRAAPDREKWRNALIQAYEGMDLSDSLAQASYYYQLAVTYLPRFVQYRAASKEAFAAWVVQFFGKPFPEIREELREKGETYWEYRVLDGSLTGIARERAIAGLLIHQSASGSLGYLKELSSGFHTRFPQSIYRPEVNRLLERYLRTQTAKDQGIRWEEPAATLDSLLARFRGKVVVVDLWGSWCGPCREEFASHPAVKEAAKGKPVVFLYIAVEHTPERVRRQRWQETVRFYELTGYHVLAGKDLEQDLMKQYENRLVFPSYILVDKSGRIVNLHAAHPSETSTLLAQLSALL